MLEYYSTIKLNDVVLACNTWMNLKSVVEQQQPDTRVCIIRFHHVKFKNTEN